MAINWLDIKEDVRTALKNWVLKMYETDQSGEVSCLMDTCSDDKSEYAEYSSALDVLEYLDNADDEQLLHAFRAIGMSLDDLAPKDRERIYRIRIIPHDVYLDGEIYLGETPKWYASNMPALWNGDAALQIYNKNKGYISFEHVFIVVDQFEELLNFNGGNTEVLVDSEEITGATIDQVVLEVAAERALSRRAREVFGIQGEYENKSMPHKV